VSGVRTHVCFQLLANSRAKFVDEFELLIGDNLEDSQLQGRSSTQEWLLNMQFYGGCDRAGNKGDNSRDGEDKAYDRYGGRGGGSGRGWCSYLVVKQTSQ
jgi:hypothetical protein